jgi:hypothetical protein
MMTNKLFQKFLVEELESALIELSIVRDKYEMLLSMITDECDCEDGCCK